MAQLGLLLITQEDEGFGLTQAAKDIGDVCDEAVAAVGVDTVCHVKADVAVSMQFGPCTKGNNGNRLLSVSF